MGRKALKITGIVLLSVIAAICIVYLVIAFYYQDKFLYGTYINGVYVKGLSVAQANETLIQKEEDYFLTLHEENGKTEQIAGSAIGFSTDYTNALTELMNRQKVLEWGYYLCCPMNFPLVPEYHYEEEKLKAVLPELACFQLEAVNQKARLEIQRNSLGYALIDETTDIIDDKAAGAAIAEAIIQGQRDVSLEDCYVPYLPTKKMQEVYALWEQIDKVQQTEIVLKDGDLERTLNVGTVRDWMLADENGMPVLDASGQIALDTEKAAEYAASLAGVFDTYGKERVWNKYNGGTVALKYSGSGYIVDQDAEAEQLLDDVLSGKQEIRKPIYAKEGKGRGNAEIGETYIEVDMSVQKLYYFVEGSLKLSTDIVTGNTSRGNGTPQKICAIYAKQKNRILRGANYASFVNYWMPVSGNIGIHDATWRDEFGGEIYKTAGSHGCINLPKEKAAALYGMAEIGTPVVIYY